MKRGCRSAVLLLLMLLMMVTPFAAQRLMPQPAFQMRRDLGIYFTNADEMVKTIRTAVKRHDPYFEITYTAQRDHMETQGAVVRDLMAAVFAETDRPDEGDYLYHQYGGCEMTYTCTQDDGRYHYTLHITPEYYTDNAQEEAVTARVREILDALDFTRSTSEYEKVLAVHDYVRTHVAFDRIHQRNAQYHLKSTAYGALIYGHAACQGYAVTVYRLLREAGVDCRILTGMAQMDDGTEEYHAWNLVRIGGLYYNLDATWDTQRMTEDYFLCGETDFTGHVRDAAYADAEFTAAYPTAQTRYCAP